ncbi:DNA-binding protein, partial [Streptococcus agalactiae]
ILSKVELHCSEFEFENISDEKMSILIGTRCISAKFSINTLNFIRDNYQNHTIEYLKEYIEEYLLEDEDNDIYQETEMLNLLQASLSHEWKFKIVDKFPTNVSIVDKEYSTILVDYILQNKFDESDLEYILSNYDCLE